MQFFHISDTAIDSVNDVHFFCILQPAALQFKFFQRIPLYAQSLNAKR